MKEVIVEEQVKYICDICGEEIKTGGYSVELLTLNYEVIKSALSDWNEKREKHVHKRCLGEELYKRLDLNETNAAFERDRLLEEKRNRKG